MNYQESIDYIHNMYDRGSKYGLSRTYELLELLGNPQDKLRFVHVAGTNGKGSTAAMTASILKAAGYRVGLYVSPYVLRFNERIQFDGKQISDEELSEVVSYIRPKAESMVNLPTEFELITALGMEYFVRKSCDIVVLEVGLGGELDSTNVIKTPDVAVICAMGYDHTHILGKTMTEIATAKAGIIKQGGRVVSYGNEPEANTVIEEKCRKVGASLSYAKFDELKLGCYTLDGQRFDYKGYKDIFLPLVGEYQPRNAAVVIETIEQLRLAGWSISDIDVYKGLASTVWPARFEVLSHKPVFIVDGGHNPHGIHGTVASLERLFPNVKFIFITGVMKDKDSNTMLNELVPLAQKFYTVRPDNWRAMPQDELAEHIKALGANAIPMNSIDDAVKAAFADAGHDSVICALGSLYMAGDVRECVRRYQNAHA
ncbi:MAG TPA: folylpolyglutamate synthase/dihydrofolate synthase family protein [Eubacteriales bacterium]|nr:folylpolyglutamate synthase/dihydrofolate synthase family protein [Clostridia bacterium]HRV72980.1 folylpolyglutamate synthase/dihydrofolate synthase family protein [Eubacteriales bacterium]